MSELTIRIGKQIKEARKVKEMKQEELAKKIGMTRSRISQIESGDSVDDHTYKKIFDILNLDSKFAKSEESIDKLEKLEIMVSEFRLIAQRNFGFARDFLRVARDIEDAYEIEDDYNFIENMTKDKWNEVRRFFGEAANGTIELIEFSPIKIAGILLEKAKKSILATSLLTPNTWWNSPLGEMYQNLNLKLAKKIDGENDEKFQMQRIFIFGSSKECEEAKEIIIDEMEAKIKVWVAYNRNLPLGLAAEILIIDNKFIGLQDIEERRIIERLRFTDNEREIDKAMRSFEMIKSLCENDQNPIENIEQLNIVIKDNKNY